MYMKTILVNVWVIILVIIAAAIHIFNVKKASTVASGSNAFACFTFPLLIIPAIVDSIVDLLTKMEPANLNKAGMIFVMILMIIVAIFGCLYAISYQRIMTQCVELSCLDYQPLNGDEGEQDYEDEGENDHRNLDSSSSRRTRALYRTDWFTIVNIYAITNTIWGFVSHNLILALLYVMRVWTIHDSNINRGADVATAAGISGILLLAIIVYDWFVFRSYSYAIFVHYITFIVFSMSLMVEFHKAVGLEEALNFVLLLISSAALVVKIVAGIRYREARYKKTV